MDGDYGEALLDLIMPRMADASLYPPALDEALPGLGGFKGLGFRVFALSFLVRL